MGFLLPPVPFLVGLETAHLKVIRFEPVICLLMTSERLRYWINDKITNLEADTLGTVNACKAVHTNDYY